MNSKQRRKWIRANEDKARAELVARTLQGVRYRHLPGMLNGPPNDLDKFEAVRHLLRPQNVY
jgi:hypothetical protein